VDVEYAGVVIFGRVSPVDDFAEMRHGLELLLEKYFPHLKEQDNYPPIRDVDLKRTAVLRLDVEAWSGKQKRKADDFPGAFHFGERV
jgi:nitroimidazol reductase NimA-like FMN-containing flavoprotein (pyridoxamine 5'-phosphate oxidase superfamily)